MRAVLGLESREHARHATPAREVCCCCDRPSVRAACTRVACDTRRAALWNLCRPPLRGEASDIGDSGVHLAERRQRILRIRLEIRHLSASVVHIHHPHVSTFPVEIRAPDDLIGRLLCNAATAVLRLSRNLRIHL